MHLESAFIPLMYLSQEEEFEMLSCLLPDSTDIFKKFLGLFENYNSLTFAIMYEWKILAHWVTSFFFTTSCYQFHIRI